MPGLFKRIEATEPEPELAPKKATTAAPAPEVEKIVVKTLHGLEKVLADELEALGATHIDPVKRAVECRGNKELIYRACYELRTAMRVLVQVHSFTAYNEKDLYHGVQNVDWSKYMDVTDTLAVDAVVAGKIFTHSQYTALLTKDAVVDQFRERTERRPNVDVANPTLRINVRVNASHVDILLDASGDSLHKRGYRRDSVEAPLNEVLAAGMILLSGWDKKSPFTDPMCGSGTLVIEAALMALDQSPQFYRDQAFGFTRWKNYDQQLWRSLKAEIDARRLPKLEFPIKGSDLNRRAVTAASINAMAAGLDTLVQFEKDAFDKATPPAAAGTLMMNPPYDERLRLSEVEGFYKSIGDTFKKNWPGWTAWVLSSNKEAMKFVGLRASRRIELINGSLECTFQKYDLYAGKKGHPPVVETEGDAPVVE